LIDLGSGRSSTGSSSSPRAMPQSQTEFLPRISFSSAPGKPASSPIVRTPTRSRSSAVFVPTPLIFVTGSGSKNVTTSSGRTTCRPFGFARADGHAASDSHLPSLVAARHDDPATRSALRVRPDDHGLAIQVRILPPLDAHVERVHIHVEHDAGHADLSPVVVKT